MNWLKRYNLEKEKQYKEEHSKITLTMLFKYFCAFLKKEHLFIYYVRDIVKDDGFRLSYQPYLVNILSLRYYDVFGSTRYLNVRTLVLIFEDENLTLDFICIKSRNKFKSTNELMEGFIDFLKEKDYYQFIKIVEDKKYREDLSKNIDTYYYD